MAKQVKDLLLAPVFYKEVEDISRSLNTLGIRFDFIITSPLKQAYLTALIVAKTFEVQKKIQEWNELTPEGNRLDLYRPCCDHILRIKPHNNTSIGKGNSSNSE
jgi:phosphohistidine phosphatase SixA